MLLPGGPLFQQAVNLPCTPDAESIQGGVAVDLLIRHTPLKLSELDHVTLIARRYGGFVRSYDLGDRLLVAFEHEIKLVIDKTGRDMLVVAHQDYQEEAATYASGLGLSICLLCQGRITLHAAGVQIGAHVIGISAASGVGKSTLLWALVNSGGRFVTDDVLPTAVMNGQAICEPAGALHAKMWKENLEYVTGKFVIQGELMPKHDKYWLLVDPLQRAATSRPVTTLLILKPYYTARPQNRISVRRQAGSAALLHMMENSHGLWTLSRSMLQGLLPIYAELASIIPVYVVEYFRERSAIEPLVELARHIAITSTTTTCSKSDSASRLSA